MKPKGIIKTKEVEAALDIIEHKNRSWKSDFMRNNSIWGDIAIEINSSKGKKNKFWCKVMDLHQKKQEK